MENIWPAASATRPPGLSLGAAGDTQEPPSSGANSPNGAWLYLFCKHSSSLLAWDCYGEATMASKWPLKADLDSQGQCFAKWTDELRSGDKKVPSLYH